MADFEALLDSLARIQRAGRPLFAQDPERGARVSAHQGRILAFLDEADPVMVGELADHLGVTASTMSLTLGRLEEAGNIRREPDHADRRGANVRLTEAGVRARDARRELDPDRLERMLSFLDPAERREALRALALLAGAADRLVQREREDVSAQV